MCTSVILWSSLSLSLALVFQLLVQYAYGWMRCSVQALRIICQHVLPVHGVSMTAVTMRMLELYANVRQLPTVFITTNTPLLIRHAESQFDYPVRLVNGNDSTEGLVEIHSPNVTGMICDYLWDLHDATVVCRQLGFQGMYHCVHM